MGKVRGSREARAIGKASKYGRKQQEAAWKNTEVDALYQLRDAGVRVPEPYGYYHGVLVMELVTDADGHSAPRLGEVELSPEQPLVCRNTGRHQRANPLGVGFPVHHRFERSRDAWMLATNCSSDTCSGS